MGRVENYGLKAAEPALRPPSEVRRDERFERAAVQRSGGFGLGLWITKQIVDAHGGTISVDSTRGGGATFRVDLPFTFN